MKSAAEEEEEGEGEEEEEEEEEDLIGWNMKSAAEAKLSQWEP